MSDFSDSPTSILLDPYRRVRYTHGLVLGVPEFEQEQLYFLEKGQVHSRALHGYGTVNGLKLDMKSGPELTVAPGLAVNPIGQLIRITRTQCANLSTWLGRTEVRTTLQTAQGDDVPAVDSEGNGHVKVHVVLCYDECDVDPVTIPGAACRSQDDTVTASRTVDSFRLSLSFTPPEQLEEEAVHDFGALLRRLVIADEGGPYATLEELLALVRDLIPSDGSDETLEEGDGEDLSPLRVRPEDACDLYCAMLRVWITEVRAAIGGSEGGTIAPTEACVLLGTLDFDITAWAPPADLTLFDIDETHRPMLAHVRLLQEWLSCGQAQKDGGQNIHTFATLTCLEERTTYSLLAWIHHPIQVHIPTSAVSVSIDGQEVPSGYFSVEILEQFNLFRIIFQNWASLQKAGALRPAGKDRLEARRKADRQAASSRTALNASAERPMPGRPGSLTHLDEGREGDGYYYYGYQLYDGARVEVRFDTTQITVGDTEGSLWDQMGDRHYNLDRDGKTLTAFVVADLPSLDDLQDVRLSEPSGGQALLYSDSNNTEGSYWFNGDVLHPGDQAGGDLTGTYPNPTIAYLQGIPLYYPLGAEGYSGNEVLTLRRDDSTGRHWEPMTVGYLLGEGKEGDVLTYLSGTWQPQTPANQQPGSGDVSGIYPNLKVVGIGGFPVKQASPLPSGSMLAFSVIQGVSAWVTGLPGGDLSGLYPNPGVSGILGFPIQGKVGTAPADGSLLRFSAKDQRWELVQNVTATAKATSSFADVFWASDGATANIRFHIQLGAVDSKFGVLLDLVSSGLLIFDDSSGTVLPFTVTQSGLNTATVRLSTSSRSSRFGRMLFDTTVVKLSTGDVLFKYCEERGLQFVGQDLSGKSITLYTIIPAQIVIG